MADLEHLASGLSALADAWDQVGLRCGDATIAGSPCALEAERLPEGTEAPDDLMRAAATDATVYVSASSQMLRGIARLVGPEVVLTGWPLTRSVVEHCGRATWVLGQVDDPLVRVARLYMERIASTHFARLAAELAGRRQQAKALRRERQRLLDQAKVLFPDAQLFEVDKVNEWSVGGEPYSGLVVATNRLGRVHLGSKGLYDTLSAYTHPSGRRLRDQMKATDLGGRQFLQFEADAAVVRWQVAVSCAAVYRAAHHVVAYLEIGITSSKRGPMPTATFSVRRLTADDGASAGAALGPKSNEKRRLPTEDAERRFRRSAAVLGNY